MKRTPLQRKTPLKRNKSLSPGGPIARKTPLKRTGFGTPSGNSSTTKARGLKGIGRTAEEVEFHNKVASLGCIACSKLGVRTVFPVRIHHVKGRKQSSLHDYSEWWVLPLCDQHHNPQLAFSVNGIKPDMEAPSVHCRHKLFIVMIGDQETLVYEVYDKLDITPPWETTGTIDHN